MIFVVELQKMGDRHIMVNSGMLQIIKICFPDKHILLTCDVRHASRLRKKMYSFDMIKENQMFDYSEKELAKKYTLHKVYRETKLAYKLFRQAKKMKAEMIFFTSAFPFTALFLNFFAKRFRVRTVICQHGDLGVLVINKKKLTTLFFKCVIKAFFQFRHIRYVTALFYGNSIKKKLFELYPKFNSCNTITIDHPYDYMMVVPEKKSEFPITIANIGVAIMVKNSHLFFKLAALCKQEIQENKIYFTQIGNISSEVKIYVNTLVKQLYPKSGFIDTEDFEKALHEADYFIYFFTKNSFYDMCPSGTFFDAIKYETPIISLHNDFFDYYFNKLGNIGYLCHSIEEMYEIITSIANGQKMEEYYLQKDNIRKAKNALSIYSIAQEFALQYNFIV
jgi:hypothetical protein